MHLFRFRRKSDQCLALTTTKMNNSLVSTLLFCVFASITVLRTLVRNYLIIYSYNTADICQVVISAMLSVNRNRKYSRPDYAIAGLFI